MEYLKHFGLVLITLSIAIFSLSVFVWMITGLNDSRGNPENIILASGFMLMIALGSLGFFFKYQAEKKDRRW